MADLIPPNRAFISQALNILQEEGFAEYLKQQIKQGLFKLDLVAVDPDMIGADVLQARLDSRQIDWFIEKLKEYCNE